MDFKSKCNLGAFSLAVLVVFSVHFAHGGRVTYEGNSTVNEGDPFTISCFLTLFDPVQWEKDGKPIVTEPGSSSVYSFHEENVDGKVMASLVVKAATYRHSGSYRCNTLTNESHHISVFSANEIVPNTVFQKYVILHYGEPLKIICNVTNRDPGLEMKWFKNGSPLTTSSGDKPNYKVEDNVVSIHRAMDDEVANYTCQLVNPKNNNSVVSRAEMEVIGKPYVKLPETVTVVEEEKLKLECIVLGKPTPTVEWIIGNKTYMASEDRVKLSSDKGIINNIMELEPAKMSDRGDIVCLADNVATTYDPANRATIYVRVKGKYAALWPFLGIVAEVIVLCAIIFIYEKKRNTSELDESDTDQSPEQKNTPDHGKESVRHRK